MSQIETISGGRKISSRISIKPYVDAKEGDMGLHKYGLSLFEDAMHIEPIIKLEEYGVVRYKTGLNEFAPEVKMLPEEERAAKIKQIREVVAELEKSLASNVIKDIKSDNFWNEVKLLKPNNEEYWDSIEIRLSNEGVYLDPKRVPTDLIKLYAIENGGFSLIAPSLEEARKTGKYKFYLDKYEETAAIVTEVKKVRNAALRTLQDLYDKDNNKLFLVSKVVDPNSHLYTRSTPIDVIYDNLDKFINGELVDRDKKKAASLFNEAASLDLETLKLRALVKDGNYHKEIIIRGDGNLYHARTIMMMGRNTSDVIEFLKNPLNEDVLMSLTKEIEHKWNKI